MSNKNLKVRTTVAFYTDEGGYKEITALSSTQSYAPELIECVDDDNIKNVVKKGVLDSFEDLNEKKYHELVEKIKKALQI